MNKYQLFQSGADETQYWNHVFPVYFKGFIRYEVASREDDDLYGVDVWVNKQAAPIRVGVQLKTSRDAYVNIHYSMECLSGWSKPVGINTYISSPKVDYLLYAYPLQHTTYMLTQSDLGLFWEIYHDQLATQNLIEYTHNNECWRYYFQVDTHTFETMCTSIEVPIYKRVI